MTAEIRAWLAERGRTRFIAGDDPPEDVRHGLDVLMQEYRTSTGLVIAGQIVAARDINAALDWKEAQDG